MIAGIGVDRCTVARMEAVHGAFGERLLSRLLTPTEQAAKSWTAQTLARRWACKEAVAKALGTGIGAQFGFQDIEITSTDAGAPQCTVKGAEGTMHVSVSDEDGVAIAFAVWEKA